MEKELDDIEKDFIFVGIDPSYVGFGIILLNLNGDIIKRKLIKTNNKQSIEERILKLEDNFQFIKNIIRLKAVYMEGVSFGSRGNVIIQMGALNYYLRIFLFKNNIPYKVITPQSLKKFVTGKGNVKKELMLLKIFKRWNIEFDNNNLADAYGLARYALEDYKKINK